MKPAATPSILLPLVLAMALAACQARDTEAQKAAAGAEGILRARTDGRLPSNLPAYLPVYPAAHVISTVDGGPRGGTVSFSSPATSAQIAEFYRARAIAAGLNQKTDVSANEVRILMFDDAPAGRRNFVLTLTSTGAGVQAAVTYGPQG